MHELLILEHRCEYLWEFLQAPMLDQSMIKLEKAVPCIMHCENRTGKRMLYMLFIQGINRCISNQECDEMAYAITNSMNCEVLGSAADPSQWKLPMEDGELGEIKFHNWRMHKIIDKFGVFINLCIR